jgi:predicted aspartyl protease
LRLVAVRLNAARLLGCLAIACLWAGQALAFCQAEKRTSVPVRLVDGVAVVDVVINDIPLPIILDTGADTTTLTAAAAAQLRLAPDEYVSTLLRGAGGHLEKHRSVTPASMLLGGVALRRRGVVTKPTLAVIAGIGSGRQVGLLGEDLLSLFDLDLDLPSRTLTLFSVQGCTGRFIPWDQPYDAIPVQFGMRSRSQPLIPVQLDHHPLTGVLDTGASVSFLNLRGMHALGLTPAMLEQDPAAGASVVGGRAAGHWHRFAAMQIGSVVLREPLLLASPVPTPIYDLLVGLDFWTLHRLWISYASGQIFVARGDG